MFPRLPCPNVRLVARWLPDSAVPALVLLSTIDVGPGLGRPLP